MRRGEVWWARFPEHVEPLHPVLLLSWDSGEDFRDQVTVAQITSTVRGLDAEVTLGPADGLLKECVANLDGIATIYRGALDTRLCTLSGRRMKEIEVAIHHALGIPLPCTVA
ncbi:MAG: type II toxin-antitoxin system PemK/MazF family toxin [Chloroflexi bacterium]|nr:MAG: type II toxin-antitoxin system PemK/MazF family toxin [Chloroflexota bacterium]